MIKEWIKDQKIKLVFYLINLAAMFLLSACLLHEFYLLHKGSSE